MINALVLSGNAQKVIADLQLLGKVLTSVSCFINQPQRFYDPNSDGEILHPKEIFQLLAGTQNF